MIKQQKYFFQCLKCNQKILNADDNISRCPICQGPISNQMNIELLSEKISKNTFYEQKIQSMWSFFEFLPLLNRKNIISLMEGNTPILKSNRLSKSLGLKSLLLKLDFLNPTLL